MWTAVWNRQKKNFYQWRMTYEMCFKFSKFQIFSEYVHAILIILSNDLFYCDHLSLLAFPSFSLSVSLCISLSLSLSLSSFAFRWFQFPSTQTRPAALHQLGSSTDKAWSNEGVRWPIYSIVVQRWLVSWDTVQGSHPSHLQCEKNTSQYSTE